ncbi:Transcription factor vrtR1 [Hyphodiscus hymeniophilus]|uniref:Transcription factor vrtR1 n=1 Tax=Hyphodiscus hymeniophilus TaxID=353542 RepID=A0A9P6VJP3_9HELO|nr:Transcription factor vrtR1 [Hyphodiscus hymeniophilus]
MLKCDRQRPCGTCIKHSIECVFKPPRPPQKRHKRTQVLTDRLRHYEALLQQQGIDPGNFTNIPATSSPPRSGHTEAAAPKELQVQTPSSIDSESHGIVNKTQVIHGQGRSKFLDNLWSRVVEEFHDPEDALEDSSNDASDPELSDDDFAFVLKSQPKSNTKSRHPPPERILQLWQIFADNVDPLTKIVHVPTLRPAIQKAASNIGAVPRGFETLMFAIYGAAVMSLKDDDCKQIFSESRKTLLSRYISATKVALSRAKFMGTTSLVVLQALVLHLLSIRDIYEPRAVWSLTGVAVRIAESMGFERDGVSLGLPPFEAEMRRRLWWLLKTHDFRTAELCGLAKFRDIDAGPESTKWPSNLNDEQLYPGMLSLPPESNMLTDMCFVSTRYELAKFAAGAVAKFREQGKNSSQWDLHASGNGKNYIAEAFNEVEQIIEMKYLRYCDPSQPLHLMTMLLGRSSMNIARFLRNHPRRWASIEQTPVSERQWVWEICVKILEQHHMVQSNSLLKQFAWHAAYFLQWHALIHVLDTLRANPLKSGAEKTWKLIGNTYENNPHMVFDTKKPIHIAVGNICLKAYSAREVALQNQNTSLPPTPEFILQLRRQRQVAKEKKEARDAKSRPAEDAVTHDARASEMSLNPDTGVVDSNNTLQATYPLQSGASNPSSLAQTGGATESDIFWYGLDNSQVGNPNDVMELDLDFMLAQDYSAEDPATQAITWEQWDAWLADSNVVRPQPIRDWRTGA